MGARELLAELTGAGFSVAADGGVLVIRPWSRLTDSLRAALRDAKPELLTLLRPEPFDLAAVAWTDADIVAYLGRRARLVRWGWTEANAERLAERLARRDREADDRVSCADCRHYRPGRCGNHRTAGLHSGEVGRDLAAMLQRCPGFDPRTTA